MESFDTELWPIGLVLDETIAKSGILQRNGVNMVPVCSDSQASICQAAQLEQGPRQVLARPIIRKAQAPLPHGIKTEIHCIP
jgi:hypothetical protein